MLNEERHKIILDQLDRCNIIKIKDLMVLTKSSESTLRRDLQELENRHLLIRIHGGAKRTLSLTDEPTVFEKDKQNKLSKTKLAIYATSLIKNTDTIFLDSGTTTKEIIYHLGNLKNILVVTNSIDNASLLADLNIQAYVPGGKIKSSTKALIGAETIQELEKFQFDISFIGTNGFDCDYGFTTPDIEESKIKNLIINHSQKSYIITDKSKLGKVSFSKFANLSEATLITEKLDQEVSHHLEKQTNILEVN